MDTAIPPHLRVERTQMPRMPDGRQPLFPAFAARYKPTVNRVVMAYFGVQHATPTPPDEVNAALAWLEGRLSATNGPGHWDRSSFVDVAGFHNILTVAYWDDPTRFDAWFDATQARWTGADGATNAAGFYIEALRPASDGYETLFSSPDRAEGVSVLVDGMSGAIQEHAYWGAARDRIPRSQTSDLASSGAVRVSEDNGCVQVWMPDHLCLIRSGQDWSGADDAERAMYLTDVEPVLRDGMAFLRDEGGAVGCIANRYATALGPDGQPLMKSYGLSWWHSLADLEGWAKSHPTHLRIFGAAMSYLSTLGPSARLRLYHEVSVVRSEEQLFEYRNCHPRTGLLAAVNLALPG